MKKLLPFFLLMLCPILATEWQDSHYLWNFALVTACDKGVPKNPTDFFATSPHLDPTDYVGTNPGDILWVPSECFTVWLHTIFPYIENPLVLLVSGGDESFPSDMQDFCLDTFLEDKRIIHLFVQNCDYKGSSNKISPLPIGLDFHTIAYKGKTGGWGEFGSPKEQEACLERIVKSLPSTKDRKLKAFVDFHHSDTMEAGYKRCLQLGENRKQIFEKIVQSGLVDHSKWMRRSALWKKKGEYAFSISPHGNGLDCHRTWEDLVLGCIVIVKTSPLDPLYEGLPVVIIHDWDEITEENMQIWISQFGDAFDNPLYREKLTSSYWIQKIYKYRSDYANP